MQKEKAIEDAPRFKLQYSVADHLLYFPVGSKQDEQSRAFVIPRGATKHCLCDMEVSCPVVPYLSTVRPEEAQFFLQFGYQFSQEWLSHSPLAPIKNARNVHLLAGAWDEERMTFSWHHSGLNPSNHLLVSVTFADTEVKPELHGALNALRQLAKIAITNQVDEGIARITMVLPLIGLDDCGFFKVPCEKEAQEIYAPKFWLSAQLEQFKLLLTYPTIKSSCRYQDAWVINENGDLIKMEATTSDRRGTKITQKCWNDLHIGDMACFYHESAAGNIWFDTLKIGDGDRSVWQKRKRKELICDVIEKIQHYAGNDHFKDDEVFTLAWYEVIHPVEDDWPSKSSAD